MNTQEYRKAYLANLNLQISNNNKNLSANKGSPAAQQYIQNSGQPILGVSTFRGQTNNIQARGTKKWVNKFPFPNVWMYKDSEIIYF